MSPRTETLCFPIDIKGDQRKRNIKDKPHKTTLYGKAKIFKYFPDIVLEMSSYNTSLHQTHYAAKDNLELLIDHLAFVS